MAQTDTRPGFRLPWTADRSDSDQPAEEPAAESGVVDAPARAEEPVTPDIIDTTETPATRRPTKFMAELSHAMQVAAESSRDETMARFGADAKTVVEEIHAASTVEAAALRRRADDDAAAVREWSKAEIARIRDEAEARIAVRKAALDSEMEAHGLVVEARVERAGATVSEFETRMAAFFERLLAEEDPTRIATMAETMPDPPDLAGVVSSIAEPEVARFDPIPRALAAPDVAGPDAGDRAVDTASASDMTVATEAVIATGPDFAAAEAEAAALTGDLDEDDEPAAAPAGADHTATTSAPVDDPAMGERRATRVVVLGLVSVASIATFKRGLGRAPGVSAIGVASGPDGEFVFTVSHDASLGLADAIAALPGFEARITTETADEIEVAAHDPDAGN